MMARSRSAARRGAAHWHAVQGGTIVSRARAPRTLVLMSADASFRFRDGKQPGTSMAMSVPFEPGIGFTANHHTQRVFGVLLQPEGVPDGFRRPFFVLDSSG